MERAALEAPKLQDPTGSGRGSKSGGGTVRRRRRAAGTGGAEGVETPKIGRDLGGRNAISAAIWAVETRSPPRSGRPMARGRCGRQGRDHRQGRWSRRATRLPADDSTAAVQLLRNLQVQAAKKLVEDFIRKTTMAKRRISLMYLAFMIVMCGSKVLVCVGECETSWSSKAAEEAEAVAAIPCSGHGRAYLDGLILKGMNEPVCECNSCYAGSDCSIFLSDCAADAATGDPYFLEPFWMQHAASSAILVSGWHRMGYSYSDGTYISKLLVQYIKKVHDIVGNAITEGKYIIFGSGITQLLGAAVYALSSNSSLSPAKVVATTPYYSLYREQTKNFNSRDFSYEGDTSLWKNSTHSNSRFIEIVTSPNNPDGKLNKGVLQGPNVKTIHDRAYYWPHFTAIPLKADDDLMLFSISKFTGHAGTRFGWGIIKDEKVYQKMSTYLGVSTIGVSNDSQLRALKILDVVVEGDGKEIFQFAFSTLRDRWIRLKEIIFESKRFTLQKLYPQYCNYFNRIRDPSPAYGWLKCEREEDKNCYEILEASGIIGRKGSIYGADNRYVRLSLIKTQDDFEILISKLRSLIAKEQASNLLGSI